MIQPLVSILTPFKNTEQYLVECLNSICNQSYQNWELLIVNDHSTDNSYSVVESYAKRDNRIKLFENEGAGVIEALRTAFKHSKGVLITRMDSDDVMTPEKLGVLSNLLIEQGRGHVAIGHVKYFSENGIGDGYDKYERWINGLTFEGSNFQEIYKECVVPSPNFMVYKDDLLKCGDFQSDLYPEDYDLTFRFYKNKLVCIPCDKLTHHWRDYSTRSSRTDNHYSNENLLDIKIHYFLALEHDANRPLAIWGAGDKGKFIARKLVKKNIPFHWICDNPNKIGHIIYGQEMLNIDYLATLQNPQSIVSVANEEAQKEIRSYMNQKEMIPMQDYFFFC
ncbi:MAG: glycosyltransferase [Cyclobacteriaceae bacterium]|nr:glycosyltransferase [Cyclobacteriaceae bacterium]